VKPPTRRQQVTNRLPTGAAPGRNPAVASPPRQRPGHPTTRIANTPKATAYKGRQLARNKAGTSHEQALNRSPRHKRTPWCPTLIDAAALRNMTPSRSDLLCASAAPPTTPSPPVAPAAPVPTVPTSGEEAANKPPASPPGTNTPTRSHSFPQPASAGFVCADRGFSPWPPCRQRVHPLAPATSSGTSPEQVLNKPSRHIHTPLQVGPPTTWNSGLRITLPIRRTSPPRPGLTGRRPHPYTDMLSAMRNG
jgi:hypothetical protein